MYTFRVRFALWGTGKKLYWDAPGPVGGGGQGGGEGHEKMIVAKFGGTGRDTRLCRPAYQEARLHCFEHGLLHVNTDHSLVNVSQPIAHRQGLPQSVAPSHGILLQGLKAASVHRHNPMELRLKPPPLTPLYS